MNIIINMDIHDSIIDDKWLLQSSNFKLSLTIRCSLVIIHQTLLSYYHYHHYHVDPILSPY
jgi:hypothetical protein